MKIKRHVGFIILALLLAITVGCKSNTDTDTIEESAPNLDSEIIVAYPSQPPSLDTHTNTTTATSNIGKNVFETLLTMDTDYKVQPMLADSWETLDDGKVIEFKLREGILFHNGEEMKAGDVVASMNRWLDNASTAAETFEDATFKEIDAYTVQLEMSKAVSTAEVVLAYSGGELPSIMPASVIEEAGDDNLTDYIGTGPFVLESWEQDQQIHLKRYEDYSAREEDADGLAGKREALVADLIFKFVPDASTRIAGIQSGEYDVAQSISYNSIDQLENVQEVNLNSEPKTILNIYLNKKTGLFSNDVARDALATGIDKEAILQASFNDPDNYEMNHNMMMKHQEGQWSSDIGKDEYNINDVDKAKEMFEEAGYDGEEITIMATRDYEFVYSSAVVLQEQLKEMGIESNLEVYDWPTFVEKRDNPDNFDLSIIPNTAKPEPSSLAFMRASFTGWTESEELDAILKDFREAPSLEAAQEKYDELQAWFIDYKPVIKIGDVNSVYAARDNISEIGYVDGAIYWNVSNSQ